MCIEKKCYTGKDAALWCNYKVVCAAAISEDDCPWEINIRSSYEAGTENENIKFRV